MENKYSRLTDYHRELGEDSAEEKYCIEHALELSIIKYEFVLDFAKRLNLERVFDIGCAYGHQSEVFFKSDIEYIGINDINLKNYWNIEKYIYLSEQYPFKLNAKDTDLAVSILCLTWNCYLYEKEKTLQEQCEALTRDFKHVLLYVQKDKLNFVSKYFKGYELLVDNFVYFYN